MDYQGKSFQDLIEDLYETNLEEEVEADETNLEAPEEAAPTTDEGESTATEGQVDEKSDEAETDSEGAEGEGEEAPVAEEAKEDDESSEEESDSEKKEDDSSEEEEETYELPSGEKVSLQELLNGYLRQSDYTQKTQQLSSHRRSMEDQVNGYRTLAREVVKDPTMKELLAEHPDAFQYLMENPQDTRALLGRETEIRKFWREFEIISEDPQIAERFLKKPEQTRQQVDSQVLFQQAVRFAQGFEGVVKDVAKEYEGIEPDDIAAHFGRLTGAVKGANLDEQQFVAAMGKLWPIVVTQDRSGKPVFRKDLIKAEFDRVAEVKRIKEGGQQRKVEQHNAEVDAALSKEPTPQASPGSGTSPAPADEKVPEYKDLGQVLEDLSPLKG